MADQVLIVEDDSDLCELLAAGLSSEDLEVSTCLSAEAGLEHVRGHDVDVVIADVMLPGMSGLEFCERCLAVRPDVPVLLMTAFGSLETAVAAIRAGAYDFLTKPVHLDAVSVRLQRVLQERRTREEVQRLQRIVHESTDVGGMLGESAPMKALQTRLARVADSDASVLITGESGTGKEVVARQLHERSSRSAGAFVAVNCSALPEQLLESELFGHKRGSFTDARSDRRGLFVEASGGTLFLDEVGEMPLGLQPKLLRALEERRIRPVGASDEVEVDFRLVAATNRDLETAMEEGRFRDDLYYRINVVHLDMPPLRARSSDVLLLAQHFLERVAQASTKGVTGITPEAAERLLSYRWPGNVRELKNCIEHAVALTGMDRITLDDLPERVRDYKPSHIIVAGDDPTELVPMEVVERRYMERVIEAVGGNKAAAARILGLDRRTLYRKLERIENEGS